MRGLVANANGITVALDITISEELKQEGIARELVNRIQNIRKDSDLKLLKLRFNYRETVFLKKLLK
jgi:isoleucyl-tRNA synthetase